MVKSGLKRVRVWNTVRRIPVENLELIEYPGGGLF